MPCDPASFKVRFPEFASVDDARIQLFIDDSVIILNPTYWGNRYDIGICYYTAHLLAVGIKSEAGSSNSTGAISSKSVDGVSISYAMSAPKNDADSFLNSTQYGQRYLTLRKTLGVPAFSI